MAMLDANIILRYLLNDNEKMASEAEAIIKNMPVQVNNRNRCRSDICLEGGIPCWQSGD